MVVGVAPFAYGQTQDATALEAQYKTCAKHYIPADKCTPEIYQQLKDKDNAPLDPTVATALGAVKEYQTQLRNPASMQVRTVYITNNKDICLEIGAQNAVGGQAVARVVFTAKGKWLDAGGLLGALQPGDATDRWAGICMKPPVLKALFPGGHSSPKLVPGTDVTDKVNLALKDGR
jgi:hypothetical protein